MRSFTRRELFARATELKREHYGNRLHGFFPMRAAWGALRGLDSEDATKRAFHKHFCERKCYNVSAQHELLRTELTAAGYDAALIADGRKLTEARRVQSVTKPTAARIVAAPPTAEQKSRDVFGRYVALMENEKKDWTALCIFHKQHRAEIEAGRASVLRDLETELATAPASQRLELSQCIQHLRKI